MSSKTALMILGVVILIVGILSVIPAVKITGVTGSTWIGVVRIIVGLIAVYISAVDSPK